MEKYTGETTASQQIVHKYSYSRVRAQKPNRAHTCNRQDGKEKKKQQHWEITAQLRGSYV